MFPFGVTFYPDQWPEERWEDEFSKISQSGFNTVRFGEMAWNWVEPREGKFNFSGMDLAMKLADKYGLKVILGIGTSQAPQWLIRKYPSARPVAHDGTLYPEYGPRPNICRDNPDFRKLAERYLQKIVKRYCKHPALLMWQIDNEPVYPPLDVAELKDYCHCPHTSEAFRMWAQKKYGTIDEANRVWGMKFWTAEFSDFSEVIPPRGGMWEAVSPHIFLDWYRFKTDSLREWTRWMKARVRKLDGRHKIGTNGFIGICPRVPDHDALAEGLDWYGWDIYPAGGRLSSMDVAMMADLWRSYTFDRDTEFHVTELQGGQNVRWGFQDYVSGSEIRLWTHQMISHGARALLYHAWRPPLFGSEVGGFGILSTSGDRTERLSSIEMALKEIKILEEAFSENRIMPQVAIAHLRTSEVETFQEQGPSRAVSGQWAEVRDHLGVMHSLDSISGAHSVLWSQFNPVAFIFERHLEQNNLPFHALLLPNPYTLKDKHVKVLKKYVYDGGILITEARFGVKDENGHLLETPRLEGLLDITYDHGEIIEEPLSVPELGLKASGFRDIISAKEGIVFSFSDGTPAVIEKRLGKGKVIYAAFSLFLSLKRDPSRKAVDYLRRHLPSPPIKLEGTGEIEATYWEGASPIIYLINHGEARENVPLSIPKKYGKAEELLKGTALNCEGGKLDLSFEEDEIKVIRLTS